jgi:DNA-binding NarL/FixJ family response regulator
MTDVQGGRVGDLSAVLRMMKPLAGPIGPEAIARNRRRIANIVCAMGPFGATPRPPAAHKLPPRLRQTLAHLLSGNSEKEIAAKLEVSKHTVHVYVKGLYRHFGASSRAELLAQWVRTE